VWHAERHGAVLVLTYIRPPENVIGFADLAELDEALARGADDDRTRVIMLTGGLPGYFIAHADLADVSALTHGTPAGPYGPQAWDRALRRIAAIPQLALGCLMRVASEAAHFRFPEVAAGAIPGAGGTQRLPRLIGLPQAARLILGGGLVMAGHALDLGLVDAVLPEPGFLDAALEWAGPFAAQPRHSLFAAKRALVSGTQLRLDQGLALEQDLFRAALASSETRAMSARAHPR
jgi:enoyl-CoA hydratase/carnithine racemase